MPADRLINTSSARRPFNCRMEKHIKGLVGGDEISSVSYSNFSAGRPFTWLLLQTSSLGNFCLKMEPCLFIVRRQLLNNIIASLHVHTMAFTYQTNVHHNSGCMLISMHGVYEFGSERRGRRTNLTSGLSLCTQSLESAGTFINGRSLVRWSCPDARFSSIARKKNWR